MRCVAYLIAVLLLSLASFGQSSIFQYSDSIFEVGSIHRLDVSFGFSHHWYSEETNDSLFQEVYNFLVDHPEIVIEVGVYTDDRGSEAYNALLSEKRGQAIRGVILEKGLSDSRIISRGYGETELIFDANYIHSLKSEEEKELAHQVNSRVELKIVVTE